MQAPEIMHSKITTSDNRTGSTSIAPRRSDETVVASPRKSRSRSAKPLRKPGTLESDDLLPFDIGISVGSAVRTNRNRSAQRTLRLRIC